LFAHEGIPMNITSYEYDMNIATSEAMMGICRRNIQKVKIVSNRTNV
jgi:hypothetical protein